MSVDSERHSVRGAGRHGQRIASYLLHLMVRRLQCGGITIVTPSRDRIEHRGAEPGPEATLVLHRWRAIRQLVTDGDLGFAESFVDGDWSSPDLAALLEMAAKNIGPIDKTISGFLPMRLINRLRHHFRANTKSGSRENISFHYDLGNAFYQCWLDESMTYSSALYERRDQALEDAQNAKLRRIVELLDLRGGERVLEIGCGWGALAVRLAQCGASVTGVTLSSEQLAYARQQSREAGLKEAVSLELTDYRDVGGRYDRVVSIEMLEAVGEAYWPDYFKTLRDRLKADGTAVLQVITIDEARFDTYRKSPDFIQLHVFPGGMLPAKRLIAEQAKAAGLKLVSTESFAPSYAKTLAEWRERFVAAWPKIAAMGFPPSFGRLWEYYLCYCEAGFRTGAIDVSFFVLAPAEV